MNGFYLRFVAICTMFFALAAAAPGVARAEPAPTACAGCADVAPAVVKAFDETLARHLRALEERDLAAYAATLNRDTTLLLPDGTLYRGKSAVVAFHRKFLADRSWTQDFEKIREVVHPRVGLAFFRVVYRSHDKAGKVAYESHFLMSLTFVREGGRWQLINDQVTTPPREAGD